MKNIFYLNGSVSSKCENMANFLSSGVFAYRSEGRALDGNQPMRYVIGAAQGANSVQALNELIKESNAVGGVASGLDELKLAQGGKEAKTVLSGAGAAIGETNNVVKAGGIAEKVDQAASFLEDLSKEKSLAGTFGKVLKFVQKNINPAIVLNAGYKVITADENEREKELCTQAVGLTGMFYCEGTFKKLAASQTGKEVLNNIAKSGGKYGKLMAAVVEGAGFAATSIAGWSLSESAGQAIYDKASEVKLS